MQDVVDVLEDLLIADAGGCGYFSICSVISCHQFEYFTGVLEDYRDRRLRGLEEVLVYLGDFKGLGHSDANLVANHQTRQFVSIDEDDSGVL